MWVKSNNEDDSWGFNVPFSFSNFLATSAQPILVFCVLLLEPGPPDYRSNALRTELAQPPEQSNREHISRYN